MLHLTDNKINETIAVGAVSVDEVAIHVELCFILTGMQYPIVIIVSFPYVGDHICVARTTLIAASAAHADVVITFSAFARKTSQLGACRLLSLFGPRQIRNTAVIYRAV